MENWGIDLAKEAFVFSAAHFLIFPDGTSERLHGHNYRVFVEVGADLSQYGLVIDFQRIKPLVRELLEALNEHWLVPGEHPVLEVKERGDGVTEVRYGDEYYAAPSGDVLVLPLNNISTENLAAFLGRGLRTRIGEEFPDVTLTRLRVGVEETPGQRGVYEFSAACEGPAQE